MSYRAKKRDHSGNAEVSYLLMTAFSWDRFCFYHTFLQDCFCYTKVFTYIELLILAKSEVSGPLFPASRAMQKRLWCIKTNKIIRNTYRVDLFCNYNAFSDWQINAIREVSVWPGTKSFLSKTLQTIGYLNYMQFARVYKKLNYLRHPFQQLHMIIKDIEIRVLSQLKTLHIEFNLYP